MKNNSNINLVNTKKINKNGMELMIDTIIFCFRKLVDNLIN